MNIRSRINFFLQVKYLIYIAGYFSNYPKLYRFLCGNWNNPKYKKKELNIGCIPGLGDAVICTAVLRQIKRQNPSCKINFYSNFSALLSDLPYIDKVLLRDEAPANTIWLYYPIPSKIIAKFILNIIPNPAIALKTIKWVCPNPDRSIVQILGDQIGLTVTDINPNCSIDKYQSEFWHDKFKKYRGNIVVINRKAAMTENKNWPTSNWNILLLELTKKRFVIEIGATDKDDRDFIHDNYIDLREKTSLEEMAAIIAVADLSMGPVSASIHIAAAFNVPSVVIYGGFEDTICAGYPENINLINQPACSPCWLAPPCPYDRKCLREITVDQVIKAVDNLLQKKVNQF